MHPTTSDPVPHARLTRTANLLLAGLTREVTHAWRTWTVLLALQHPTASGLPHRDRPDRRDLSDPRSSPDNEGSPTGIAAGAGTPAAHRPATLQRSTRTTIRRTQAPALRRLTSTAPRARASHRPERSRTIERAGGLR